MTISRDVIQEHEYPGIGLDSDLDGADRSHWSRPQGISLPAPNRSGISSPVKESLVPSARSPVDEILTHSPCAREVCIGSPRHPLLPALPDGIMQCVFDESQIPQYTLQEEAEFNRVWNGLKKSPAHYAFLKDLEETVLKNLGDVGVREFYRGAHIIFNDASGNIYHALFNKARDKGLLAIPFGTDVARDAFGVSTPLTPSDVMDKTTAMGSPAAAIGWSMLGNVGGELSAEDLSRGKMVRRRPDKGETSHYKEETKTNPNTLPQLGLDLPADVGGHILFGVVPTSGHTFVQTEGGGFQNLYEHIYKHGLGAFWNMAPIIGGWQTGLIGYSTHSEKTNTAIQQQYSLKKGRHHHSTLPGSLPARSAPASVTGLPDRLKSGIEALTGLSMDDVRVHYDSPKPTEFGALAFAQGTEIHLGPGQEQHLPHEAWHVVQQAQGRVRPTRQLRNGALINDDVELEHEAQLAHSKLEVSHPMAPTPLLSFAPGHSTTIQRVTMPLSIPQRSVVRNAIERAIAICQAVIRADDTQIGQVLKSLHIRSAVPRIERIRAGFSAIMNFLANHSEEAFRYDDSVQAFAYVYPGQPSMIYLGADFFGASHIGDDSKAGTLIHEVSHFSIVLGTDDHGYGDEIYQLPFIHAIRNADTWERIGENIADNE